jgi:hypothetical protein
MRESAEDLFSADLVLGEVDHLRPGAGLGLLVGYQKCAWSVSCIDTPSVSRRT